MFHHQPTVIVTFEAFATSERSFLLGVTDYGVDEDQDIPSGNVGSKAALHGMVSRFRIQITSNDCPNPFHVVFGNVIKLGM